MIVPRLAIRCIALGALLPGTAYANVQPVHRQPAAEEAVYSRGAPETPARRAREQQARIENAEQRRRDELEREAIERPPELETRCGDDRPQPSVCIEHLGPSLIGKGGNVRYRISWRNLTEPLRLAATVERTAPVGTHWRYLGHAGRLSSEMIQIVGDGAREFEWNGRIAGCHLTLCDAMEVGEYRLAVYAFAVTPYRELEYGVPLHPVHTAMRAQGAPLISWAKSAAFRIDGEPNLTPFLRRPMFPLAQYLRQRLGFFIPFYDWSLLENPLPARRTRDGYCADITLRPPLRGILRACLPLDALGAYGANVEDWEMLFSGEIGFLPGLIPEADAEIIARRLAMRGYEQAADYIGGQDFRALRDRYGQEGLSQRTWLETEIREAIYRREAGGFWLFVVEQTAMFVGRNGFVRGSSNPAGLSDRLLVKVEPNGRACVVGRGPAGSYRPSIQSQEPVGGLPAGESRRYYDIEAWSRPCREIERGDSGR